MRSRYKSECTEWDAQASVILLNAMVATCELEKKQRYIAAAEAIGDRYAELVEGRIEKVYDVEVARKYTTTVVADSEGDARAKALDGLALGDGESVAAEVK